MILRGDKGFSLVEMLMSAGLLAAASLGLASYFFKQIRFQEQSQNSKVQQEILQEVFKSIYDDTAWSNTINSKYNQQGSAEMLCLANGTDCRAYEGVDTPFVLFDRSSVTTGGNRNNFNVAMAGNVVFDPRNTVVDPGNPGSPGGTNGFTRNGKRCVPYPSQSCVYTISSMTWRPLCPSAATEQCKHPLIRIKVQLTAVNALGLAGISNSDKKALSFSGNYNRLILYRNATSVQKFDSTTLQDNMPVTTAFGQCNNVSAGTGMRSYVSPDADQDPGGNVTMITADTARTLPRQHYYSFILKAGVYECELSSIAFQVKSHQVRLMNPAATVTYITGTTEYSSFLNSWSGVSQSFGYGTLNLSANTQFVVRHFCEANNNVNDLGLPAGLTTDEIYSQVRCTRMK